MNCADIREHVDARPCHGHRSKAHADLGKLCPHARIVIGCDRNDFVAGEPHFFEQSAAKIDKGKGQAGKYDNFQTLSLLTLCPLLPVIPGQVPRFVLPAYGTQ
ncbi:MAG: hypothetical protein V2I30_12135 [Erythrobacter sp.]|jgi:hypothetical protein|nr:hypothetical protein [Erythrobacter sp.]